MIWTLLPPPPESLQNRPHTSCTHSFRCSPCHYPQPFSSASENCLEPYKYKAVTGSFCFTSSKNHLQFLGYSLSSATDTAKEHYGKLAFTQEWVVSVWALIFEGASLSRKQEEISLRYQRSRTVISFWAWVWTWARSRSPRR